MPLAQIVAVVSLGRVAGGSTEISNIARGPSTVIFVISGCWARAIFKASPCGAIAVLKVLVAAVRIREVARGENRGAWHFFNQVRCCVRTREIVAAGNIAGTDQDGIVSRFLFVFLLAK